MVNYEIGVSYGPPIETEQQHICNTEHTLSKADYTHTHTHTHTVVDTEHTLSKADYTHTHAHTQRWTQNTHTARLTTHTPNGQARSLTDSLTEAHTHLMPGSQLLWRR